MGNLCGQPLTAEQKEARFRAKSVSKRIQDEMEAQQNRDANIIKLLLLGAGESGKSTLFKQMINLYKKGFSEEDRKDFIPVVFSNTISAMKTLVQMSDQLEEEQTHVRASAAAAKDYLNSLPADAAVDAEGAEHIKTLWADDGIQATYEQRAKFQFPDSAEYFFGRCDDMCQPDFIPNQQDVLKTRVRTTGIVETLFDIDGREYRMFDVGGQRNERKKWIHCFENVTCVIFVAAVSEYDQVLFEDESTNRMIEALDLFEEICNSRWFQETTMILFLNKRDLFEDKLKKVPLSDCFPDYHGDNSFDDASRFLEDIFQGKNRHEDKKVYSHVTCATDTQNIALVMETVKETVITNALKGSGLL